MQTPRGMKDWRRRDFLRIGGYGALALTWPHGLASVAGGQGTGKSHARACILIWLDGGPSHLDMFDPKPDAPVEIRGPFSAISSSIPGVAVSELMPSTARILDRVTLIRSMTSPLGEHNCGTHYLLSGYKPTPALDYPSWGAVLTHFDHTPHDLPKHIAVPNHRVGGGRFVPSGYLPKSTAPLPFRSASAAL